MTVSSRKYMIDDGKVIQALDLIVWAKWFETSARVRHLKTTTMGPFRVVTFFTGLDMRFHGEGDPILWETHVHPDIDCDVFRYTSREAALEGHERIVALALEKWNETVN